MRVLVTGGSGRAGRHVVHALAAAGHEVVSVDRRPPEEPLPGGLLVARLDDPGEVYDVVAQAEPDAVCHLAAIPAPEGDPQVEVFRNNCLSTYYVLQAAVDLGSTRIVYASSGMATGLITPGAAPSRVPFDESERIPTPNAYALSKYVAEVVGESLAARTPGPAIIGLRLPLVISEDNREWLVERRQEPWKGSDDFWGYIDARDAGTAFAAAVEADTSGHDVFLVAAADSNADRPLRDLMAEFYEHVPVDPGLADEASAIDIGKAKRLLGWAPQHSWRDWSSEADARR